MRASGTGIAMIVLGVIVACARPPVGLEPARRPAVVSVGAGVARAVALRAAREAGLRDAPGSWVLEGPTNVPGRVTAIGVDPNDRDRIWIGTAAGGVFLSTDGGGSFVPVFDDQTALAIGSLAVHPTDSSVVYVGTGEDNGAGYTYNGEGVFKTTDGGLTWSNVGLASSERIQRIAIDPSDGDRLFAAVGGDWYAAGPDRGIYRSLDGGATWEHVLFVASDAGGVDVAIDPANPSRVFAAIWERLRSGTGTRFGGADSGIWRSEDGGDSWTRLTAGLPTAPMGKIGLAIAPTAPNVVYANVIDPVGLFQGIYRSQDGGDTWVRRDGGSVGGLYSSFGYYFSRCLVDPRDEDVLFIQDIRLLRSGNGGKSVQNVTNVPHVDWHDLVVEPDGRMLGATDGGLWVSPDDGRTWTRADLAITQIYDLAIDAGNPARRFVGTQDNGTQRTVTAGIDDWDEVLIDDGMHCEVDPTNSDRVYASRQRGRFERSIDGGETFTPARDGIDPTERVNWVAPLTLDPVVPTTMYTGAERVYRSTDAMVSWSPISPPLDHVQAASSDAGRPERAPSGRDHTRGGIAGTVTAIAVSPVDTDVLWAGTDDGHLWVTENAGGSWLDVTPPDAHVWVTDIAADPTVRERAVVTSSGYRSGLDTPFVSMTADLGQTWSDAAGDLPDVPVESVVVDTDWRGRLFVGTDLGVFVSDDDGASWSVMHDGMPWVVVLDLVRVESSDTLFAGTHGRSMYSFDLAQLGPADGDGDGVDNNLDCALADAGAFAPPGEVTDLTVASGDAGEAVIGWADQSALAGPGTRYDVARGSLDDASANAATSFACGVATTEVSDPEIPAAGTGFFYLGRARNVCGVGTWGTDSAGTERAPSACP